MFLRCFKVDDASRSVAYNISIFNLVSVVFLMAFFTGFGLMVTRDYDVTTMHIGRLAFVEAGLHLLFTPFCMILPISIKNNNLKWINIWVRTAITQSVYLFLLNLVMDVYICMSLDVLYGSAFIVYTLLHEGFLLDIIVFMNNYHRVSIKINQNDPSKSNNKEIEDAPLPTIIHV